MSEERTDERAYYLPDDVLPHGAVTVARGYVRGILYNDTPPLNEEQTAVNIARAVLQAVDWTPPPPDPISVPSEAWTICRDCGEAWPTESLRDGTHDSCGCGNEPGRYHFEVVPKSEKLRAERERDEAREALRNICDELSHGATANYEYIDRQFLILEAHGRLDG